MAQIQSVECGVIPNTLNGVDVANYVDLQTHDENSAMHNMEHKSVLSVKSVQNIRMLVENYGEDQNYGSNTKSDTKETDLTEFLKPLVPVDLSLSNLETKIGDFDNGEVQKTLKTIDSYNPNEITEAERENIKEMATSGYLLKDICEEHPFRDVISVEKLGSELNPFLRRTKFKNNLDQLLYISQWYTAGGINSESRETKSAEDEETKNGRHLRPRRPKVRSPEPEEPSSNRQVKKRNTKKTTKTIVVDQETIEVEKHNPFDPENILEDSPVDLHGRRAFTDSIYNAVPSLPPLPYNIHSNLGVSVDSVATDNITHHTKHYKNLLSSFPPLFLTNREGDQILNVNNRIRVRFLLYPMHCEEYVLVQAKSNQLDPVDEIIKFFQVNYGLYFSGSRKIRDIIVNDYCQALRETVELDDFQTFVTIVDRWNQLVQLLSPNASSNSDINPEIRGITRKLEKHYSSSDLKLDVFKKELRKLVASNSAGGSGLKTRQPHSEPNGESERTTLTTGIENQENTLLLRLASNDHISRYALHQILSRVYARVVSISSNKLRSYKAFTAEVYGELLPCFTSEVLTKVGMKPHHKFYDLGSGVGNTTLQAALEFGSVLSGGCELMEHASKLTFEQSNLVQKNLQSFGLKQLNLKWALLQSFADNEEVRSIVTDCDVLLVNNYLFDAELNYKVGKLLYGLRPGSKIISLRNFISPRYKASHDNTIFDYLQVEKHEMEHNMSVSWTANKVPYYISVVQKDICKQYL